MKHKPSLLSFFLIAASLLILILLIYADYLRLGGVYNKGLSESEQLRHDWSLATLFLLLSFFIKTSVIYLMNWGTARQCVLISGKTYSASLLSLLVPSLIAALSAKDIFLLPGLIVAWQAIFFIWYPIAITVEGYILKKLRSGDSSDRVMKWGFIEIRSADRVWMTVVLANLVDFISRIVLGVKLA